MPARVIRWLSFTHTHQASYQASCTPSSATFGTNILDATKRETTVNWCDVSVLKASNRVRLLLQRPEGFLDDTPTEILLGE